MLAMPRLLAFVWLLPMAAAACETDAPSEPPLSPGQAPAANSAARASAGPSGAASAPETAAHRSAAAIVALRERLQLEPRAIRTQRIAFVGQRLAQLTEGELVVVDTNSWQTTLRIPIDEPRALGRSSGAGLVALGRDESLWLPAGAKKPQALARVSFFHDSELIIDATRENGFFVLHRLAPALFRYSIDSGSEARLSIGATFELTGKLDAEGAFTSLEDGSFAYVHGGRLHRAFASGKKRSHPLPSGSEPVWRLLPGPRKSEVWIVRLDGRCSLVNVSAAHRSLRELELGAGAVDIAASNRFVALVRVETPPGARRRFALRVITVTGKPVLDVPLSAVEVPAAGDDWLEKLLKDHAVVVAERAPLVAIGGPGRISVYDVEQGRPVLGR
jgi:hypothetical protein